MKNILSKKQYSNLFLILFIIFVCLASVGWWLYSQFHLSTDNAYVNANVIEIAPEVSGRIQHLNVVNNQEVKADELLLALDPAIYVEEVSHAKAQFARAEAELSIAKITANRTKALVHKRAASSQEGDIANAKLQSAEANLMTAKAAVKTALLHLQYTHIFAPVSGWVTRLLLQPGDVVAAWQSLFALVGSNVFWIDANFRETDLGKIHVGQLVDIQIDMYPKHKFHGRVESISRGTGSVFSLFPPENATGNWVKVTQRVPIKISILDASNRYPLRIGSSAKVSIAVHPWA